MTRHVVGRLGDVAPGQLRTERLGEHCPRCRHRVLRPATWRDGDSITCCFTCAGELRPAHPVPGRHYTGYAWLEAALASADRSEWPGPEALRPST